MRARSLAVAAAALTFGFLLAVPPYFGIVASGADGQHASLGHFPRWAPPTPDDVCAAVRLRVARQETVPSLTCPPSADQRPLYEARVNRVRLVMEMTAVAFLTLIATVVARPRRKGRP